MWFLLLILGAALAALLIWAIFATVGHRCPSCQSRYTVRGLHRRPGAPSYHETLRCFNCGAQHVRATASSGSYTAQTRWLRRNAE